MQKSFPSRRNCRKLSGKRIVFSGGGAGYRIARQTNLLSRAVSSPFRNAIGRELVSNACSQRRKQRVIFIGDSSRIDFHGDGKAGWKAAVDRTIENLASGCTRISRFTAPPTCFPVDVAASVCPRPRDIPPILFAYVRIYIYIYTRICIHTSTFAYRLCSARARALMYHLRRWTDVCIRVGIRLREGKAVPPVSVARVCYARPGMFPTKLTSPRLDALAQSGIESPSVAVTA